MHDLDATAVVFRAAEASGMPQRLLEAARAEILELVALVALADRRRLATFRLGQRIESMRSRGVRRSAICTELGIDKQRFHRALNEYLESRYFDGAGFGHLRKEPDMDLRKTSLGIGLTPASLPKIANPKPAPPTVDSPRDAGMMADGSTGGNYSQDLSKIGINGTNVASDAAESAAAAFEGNAQ